MRLTMRYRSPTTAPISGSITVAPQRGQNVSSIWISKEQLAQEATVVSSGRARAPRSCLQRAGGGAFGLALVVAPARDGGIVVGRPPPRHHLVPRVDELARHPLHVGRRDAVHRLAVEAEL